MINHCICCGLVTKHFDPANNPIFVNLVFFETCPSFLSLLHLIATLRFLYSLEARRSKSGHKQHYCGYCEKFVFRLHTYIHTYIHTYMYSFMCQNVLLTRRFFFSKKRNTSCGTVHTSSKISDTHENELWEEKHICCGNICNTYVVGQKFEN